MTKCEPSTRSERVLLGDVHNVESLICFDAIIINNISVIVIDKSDKHVDKSAKCLHQMWGGLLQNRLAPL